MKNKPISALNSLRGVNKKFLQIMKLLVLFFALSVFHAAGSAYSQKTSFNLDYQNVRVGDILRVIENSSEYKFLYRTDLIDLNRKVELKTFDAHVEEVLDMIFPDDDMSYRMFEDDLIAITSSFLEEQPQQILVSGSVVDSGGAPLPGVSVVVKGTTTVQLPM
jgi:TonB-dependent starch-binding outer membrane protein SusC